MEQDAPAEKKRQTCQRMGGRDKNVGILEMRKTKKIKNQQMGGYKKHG